MLHRKQLQPCAGILEFEEKKLKHLTIINFVYIKNKTESQQVE
jgi:hypothetical protein